MAVALFACATDMQASTQLSKLTVKNCAVIHVSQYLGVIPSSQRYFAVHEASSVLDQSSRRLISIGVGSN